MPADSPTATKSYLNGWFVPNDIDGFFGLFVDNLCQIIVIVGLCPLVGGIPVDIVVHNILPGIAISLVAGNFFYAWQARRLSRATGKPVTALPFGVNTVSMFIFIFAILGPVYQETKDGTFAWHVSLVAGFIGGVVEVATSFVGAWIRRNTPRAALLSTLAGIGITFIAMGFIFQIFASPLVALFPALIVFIGYAGRVRWPFGLPTGFIAVAFGTLATWILRETHAVPTPVFPDSHLGLNLPKPMDGGIFSLLTDHRVWKYAAFFLPMAVLNVIGSIMNLESAEAAGDKFDTRSSLLVNGAGAMIGVCFGNPFAPTIYIGHPVWKSLGAQAGYSVMNAVAVTAVCLTGAAPFVLWFMPVEVTLGILLWIGLFIAAQAFQEVPKAHAPAVAIGFIPVLAAWAQLLLETTMNVTGQSMHDVAVKYGADLFIYGLLSLAQGYMLVSVFLSAIAASVIDQRWRTAAVWCLIAATFSICGLIHAFVITPGGVEPAYFQWTGMGGAIPSGADFAVAYVLAAALLLGIYWLKPAGAVLPGDQPPV